MGGPEGPPIPCSVIASRDPSPETRAPFLEREAEADLPDALLGTMRASPCLRLSPKASPASRWPAGIAMIAPRKVSVR